MNSIKIKQSRSLMKLLNFLLGQVELLGEQRAKARHLLLPFGCVRERTLDAAVRHFLVHQSQNVKKINGFVCMTTTLHLTFKSRTTYLNENDLVAKTLMRHKYIVKNQFYYFNNKKPQR